LAELVRDPGVLAERVGAARVALAAGGGLGVERVPERAVASVVFLGIAARLVSPVLAATVLTDGTPLWTVEDIAWRSVDRGPWPLAVTSLRTRTGGDAAERVAGHVSDVVTPLLDAVRHRYRVSPKVLWGNVASAVGGAAGMLADAVPGRARAAGTLTARLLDIPPLAGTAEVVWPDSARPRPFLVRRNCCLFYRIPGGGTCADCVLTPPAERERHWRSVLDRWPAPAT
jgi:ferric iron reductase protein FhuF